MRFEKPTPSEVVSYARKIGFILDGNQFCDYYESKGWMVGKSPMKVWQAAVRTWKNKQAMESRYGLQKPPPLPPDPVKLKEAQDRTRALMEREWERRNESRNRLEIKP